MRRRQHLQKMQHLDLDLVQVGEMDQREAEFLDQATTISKDTQQKLQPHEDYWYREGLIQLQREEEIHQGLELIRQLSLISFNHRDMDLEQDLKQLR